jgi:hypothetical protein
MTKSNNAATFESFNGIYNKASFGTKEKHMIWDKISIGEKIVVLFRTKE